MPELHLTTLYLTETTRTSQWSMSDKTILTALYLTAMTRLGA